MDVFWFCYKTTSAIFVALSRQQTGRERKAALPWAAQLGSLEWGDRKMGAKLRSIMGNTSQLLQETMTSALSTTGRRRHKEILDPSTLLRTDYKTKHAQSNWAIKMNNIKTMCNITHYISVLKQLYMCNNMTTFTLCMITLINTVVMNDNWCNCILLLPYSYSVIFYI